MLPEGTPARWLDRGTLWNEVEAGEKRKDAQLARDIEISLPRELGKAEAIKLAQDFVREQFVSRGMVADLNVHWTQAKDGEAQPHAHIMLTMRAIVPGREGHPEDGGFGQKVVAWNDRALLGVWRERWASLANERLAQLGHDLTIDHRSYATQGIVLEPQHKIGPAGMRRAHRGEDAERAAEHVEIARRNGEAIIAQPDVVLEAITRQQSTFTRRDLARYVDRHTADRDQFDLAMAKVDAAPALVRLGTDGRGHERFTTREMLAVEQRMEQAAGTLAGRDRHRVLQAAGWRAVKAAERGGLVLGDEQRAAFRHITAGPDLALVVGYAGTGKSAMLGVARAAWEAEGYTVRGAALSGIAAEGLEAGSGMASRTLASLEFGWKDGRDKLTSRDVLVIDEAGLVGSRQMERVLSHAQAAGAKVVLIGDPEQLQAIEAGAAFRALAERHGAADISEVRRQREAWQRDATRELATERTAEALGRYAAAGMVHAAETREDAKTALVAGWDAVRRASPQVSQVILAYTRDDVRDLNGLTRAQMRATGALLGADQVVQTERGARAFAAGDRIMFLRNERGLGAGPRGEGGVAVKNGTLGTVLAVAAEGERLTVRLDGAGPAGRDAGGRVVTFDTNDYAHIDHGYAATIHKAQGVTVDRAHVLASGHMDRHAAYVALTRHRDGVALHYGRDEFSDAAALARRLGRERLKDTSLDYPPESQVADLERRYAERRGLDPLHPVSEIVVRESRREAEPVRQAVPEQAIAQGRAGFRERYAAHRQGVAAAERDGKARDLVANWDRLTEGYAKALPDLEADSLRFGVARAQLRQFGEGLRDQPELVRVLRERGATFGLDERPDLARVLADAQPLRAIAGMMDAAEVQMRGQLRDVAEKEAVQAREERATRRSLDRGHGMGL
jgi:Ti-type conjugative transfer relaxase TraA